MRLLVVCLGNICRSPLGEGALQAAIAAAGLQQRIAVDSAGTGGWHVGEAPDHRAIACAKRHGVDISGQRARQLTVDDFHDHDWILCADRDNLRAARALAPAGLEARAVLWLEWSGITSGGSVPDPYYGDETDFETVWTLVERAATATVTRVVNG